MKIIKKLNLILNIVFTITLILVAYLQISLFISKKNNHGVATLFGKSMLYIFTDSMDDPNNPNSLSPGTGIIIESIKVEDVRVSTPIFDEDGIVVDYQKDGDIVSFYCPGIDAVNTHRVVEKKYIESERKTYFITMGDNPILHHLYLAEMWSEEYLMGKVIDHSRALGSFFEIATPEAAAYLSYRTNTFHIAWLFPTLVLFPAFIISTSQLISYFIKRRKQKDNEKEDE